MTRSPTALPRVPLGKTGRDVPLVAFGAGPVPALWTTASPDRQDEAVERALTWGINWFDTAAGYGAGQSEANLGAALCRLNVLDRVDIATKVRLETDDLADIRSAVRRSIEASLRRLGVPGVTLIQLHNSVTIRRGDEATSLALDDVLAPGAVADLLSQLRDEGLCQLIGFTGLGAAETLRAVVASRRFDTLQIPFSLANSTAAFPAPSGWHESDYGQVLDACRELGMGVFAIRVYAGGALAGNPPSEYTRQTRFFKLDLYERDQRRAARLTKLLPADLSLKEAALRYALSHGAVSAAIVGMASTSEIDEAAAFALAGRLPPELLDRLRSASYVDDGS